MQRSEMFKVVAYTDFLTLEDGLLEYAQEQTSEKTLERSNVGGNHSKDFYTIENESVRRTFVSISDRVQKITEEFGMKHNPTLMNYWFIRNRRGDYNKSHCHPFCNFSGVLYLKVPSNSGKIVFERPDPQPEWFRLEKFNELTFETYHFNPKPGLLVLFPAYLRHYVEQNRTEDEDDERICMSFNFS